MPIKLKAAIEPFKLKKDGTTFIFNGSKSLMRQVNLSTYGMGSDAEMGAAAMARFFRLSLTGWDKLEAVIDGGDAKELPFTTANRDMIVDADDLFDELDIYNVYRHFEPAVESEGENSQKKQQRSTSKKH